MYKLLEIKERVKYLYFEEHIKNQMTYKAIQQKHGIHRGIWQYYVNKMNLVYDKRQYRCIDNYFDNIDSSNKAYILGFLYADGCITKDGRISILLQEKDIEILEFIKNEICPLARIHNRNYQNIKRSPQITLRFKSQKIYNRLIELGFSINKTKVNSNIFQYIPDLFKSDFIRGYCDGSIRCQYRKRNHNTNNFDWAISVSFSNGSRQILEDIQEYLLSKNITNGKLNVYKNNCFVLSYHRKLETYKYCKLIYSNNSFSLKRKKDLALKVIELCNNTEVN